MYPVLPDAEQALVDFLTDHATLAALHGGRVGTELHTPELACLQVTPLGGPQPWPWEAVPEFSVAAWGGTKAEASALSRAVAAAAYELAGTAVIGGRVVGVGIRLASLWAPDEVTGRPRYRSDLALTVMP